MNLYEVRNGFTGESVVKCFVVAESAERAEEIATPEYKKVSKGYTDNYWIGVVAFLVFENCNIEHIGEVRDY